AMGGDGGQRRGQVDAAQADRGRDGRRRRRRGGRSQRTAGLLRAARDGAAGPRTDGVRNPGGRVPPRECRAVEDAGRLLRFLARLSNRVLELGPSGPTLYGGGYTEYVARSGHEAPGLR